MPKLAFTINHDILIAGKVVKSGTKFVLDESKADDAAQLAVLRASGRLEGGEIEPEEAPAKESPKTKTK